jgi:hypothetical protein
MRERSGPATRPRLVCGALDLVSDLGFDLLELLRAAMPRSMR